MITATQSLTGDQTLVSAGGVFELGFFNPGESESYIGIWYKQVSPRTVIWVANGDKPVRDRFSAKLKISDDGELALFHGRENYTTWSSPTYNASSSVKAVLLDQGNLVLLQTNGSSSSPLWQSFDEPGDTWVPGCKIGLNKVTGQEVFLNSGAFYLRFDSHLLLEWYFDEISTKLPIIENFNYVDNENERYITFSQYNRTQIDKIVVDAGGQIQLLIWAESTKQWMTVWKYTGPLCGINGYYCGAYGSCTEKSSPVCNCLKGFSYQYDESGISSYVFDDPVVGSSYMEGCNRRYPLQCEKPDWFFPYYNVTLPDYPNITSAASSQDCKTTCLRSCSCNAYSYNEDKQCFHWYVMLYNLQLDIPNGETIYIKLAASEFSTYVNKKRNKIAIMIGSVVGSSVLLVLVLFIIFRWRHHIMLSPTNLMEGSLVVFTYRHLKIYTKNFSDKLAEGGFGAVYKGTLPDSSVVAVKKLERINFRIAENHEQFLAEVRTLGTIQHINLVGLRGFSSDKSTMMLVYDYMPNGSVASHLFKGNDDSNILDWKTRYSIALGTARGLAYLHENCRECIIHYDIKPENVFLDSEFRPKVADFGMEKLFGRDFNRVLTTLKGTIGYLAPEWISGEAITAKADVYSYGMVLFELVSGMRNSQRHVCVGHYFPLWVANVINEGGNVAELLDPKLQGNADVEELERVCRVALWCIQNDQSHRPTMSHVVYFLEQVLEVNIPPVPRILKVFVDPDPEN
ncbi:G-type lectin S-receptor-like serine/threonine-protein kinase At2g19130 [Linum perenne]